METLTIKDRVVSPEDSCPTYIVDQRDAFELIDSRWKTPDKLGLSLALGSLGESILLLPLVV